ncbi:MAG: hypothetical protein KHX34_04605 [Clostridiales bacterium]|nr:hypothetical protein [Clostridiales bacterium]
MQLKQRIKRLAAFLLALSMALGCMPGSAWAETATPSDLIATDGEASPDTMLPSATPEPEGESGFPGTENSETTNAPGNNDDLPADAPSAGQEESAEETPGSVPADTPQDNAAQEALPDELPIQAALREQGHVYAATVRQTCVYSNPAMAEDDLLYTPMDEIVWVLATEFMEPSSVKIWFLNDAGEVVCGYVQAGDLDTHFLLDVEISQIQDIPAGEGMTDIGMMTLFIVSGAQPAEGAESEPAETQEDTVPDEQQPVTETPNDDAELQPEQDESGDAAQPLPDSGRAELLPPDENADELALAVPGEYVSVTTDTRVFDGIDAYAVESNVCAGYLGQFVRDATVQVISAELDERGNGWYEVRFLYGDDFADGTMKWTDYATCFVMAAETGPSDGDACTVTDFAYSQDEMRQMQSMSVSLMSTPMNGFSLKNINGSVGGFYAGQSSLYGSSGKDSAYPQIAKSPSHGTIYATPHYLEGFTVYCLEHNLSGPGEGSGSSQTAKGPYVLVDMDDFVNNPGGGGVSGVRFSARTMHALAWVLRHTYPFMALNRSDSNNEVWSRVAGQFAMREVIKQLEGAQYVRSYWDMDNFYAFSGGAPAVYLAYARWLAENGIARASITGKITASNQSLSVSGSQYIGTVTLTTDADLIRIPKSVGTLTGNSAGADSNYYYLRSGDTIQVTSSLNRFAISMESISSDEEEANFLVGIPSVSIQKVMVPLYGAPYALQTASVTFELKTGEIRVTKKSSDGLLLQGDVFELLSSSGSVLATKTTGADGVALFPDLTPGMYTVREKTAPQGYALSASASGSVSVVAGMTADAAFVNDRIMGRIRIVKTDSLTGKPLAGAVFTVTRLSGPASDHAADIGKVVATLTTNAQGIAETGLLPWGEYKITEAGVPDGYLDAGYTANAWIK